MSRGAHPTQKGTSATGRSIHRPGEQPVTFVELFFDLVFVFAVTQLTAFLDADVSAIGIVHSLILFWLIWWAWTQFTWTLNPADTTHNVVRLVTLAATALAFGMATGVPGAFTGDALWFAVPYVIVRLLGLGLQLAVELQHREAEQRLPWVWFGGSIVGLLLVLAGAVVDPNLRLVLWLAAIGADLSAAALAGRGAWDLSPSHMAERHGLFVIIAIGESLIIAGTGLTEEGRTPTLLLVGAATLLLATTMWWSYFAWLKDAMEHAFARATPAQRGALARDAYSVAHFPLIFGIVCIAVGIKEILHHAESPLDVRLVSLLAAGVALFAASGAIAYWRLTRRVLVARLGVCLLTVPAALIAAALPPIWPLLIVALGLLAIVVIEQRGPAAHPPEPRP